VSHSLVHMIDFISQPWPWYVAGPMIALVLSSLLFFGKEFGFSSNLRTMCAIGGAGAASDFFNINWKNQVWNLIFLLGSIIGGFISFNYLTSDPSVILSSNTISELEGLGFSNVGDTYLPAELFGTEALSSVKGIFLLLLGGFLVGFGARYAGGCTSGHAISGLSNLQIPSLIAVVGFFIGGLIMVYGIMPYIL